MVKQKIEQLYNDVKIGGFLISRSWDCKYYQYFNNVDKEIRAGSTFAYMGMLHSWLASSSFVFLPATGEEFKDCYHQFNEYLKAFLRLSESISNEFPAMHQLIVQALYDLDEKKNLDQTFSHIKKNLFDRMRDELFSYGMSVTKETYWDYDGVYKKIGFRF